MTESLENILSGQREAAPAQEEKIETQAEANQPTQETVDTQAEGGEKPEGERQKMVPHEALHAEKQKVKRYTEEVAEFRRSNENLQKQINELLQRVPVPQKEQQQPIEWFENPGGAFDQNFQQSINPILSPVLQNVQALQSELAQMRAERVFGDKYGEFMEYVKANANDPEVVALAAAMDRAPNPYAYAKDWFEKKTFDPNAERERIKAELLKEMEQSQQQTQPTVMPSNLAAARNVGTRSGPNWSGPPSLTDIFKR